MPVPLGSQCPDGYSYYDGSCYKLYSQQKKFYEAERFCTREPGGHLASFSNRTGFNFLVGMVRYAAQDSSPFCTLHIMSEMSGYSKLIEKVTVGYFSKIIELNAINILKSTDKYSKKMRAKCYDGYKYQFT